jgi:hypothetical protein
MVTSQGSAFRSVEPRNSEIAGAHRSDGQRFFVRADEKLTAFLELDSAICAGGE